MKASIRVEGLCKSYGIAHNDSSARYGYRTLRETISDLAAAPIRRLRGHHHGRNAEEFWALKDVSFEVHPGEIVGLIGRNGAGKSTLLKILSRITKPTRGHAELHGRVGSLLEVGSGFHPELTGRENIYLNGSILGMTKREITRRFDEIVDFAEIERFLDTPVKRYSSGMYVRLAFAVAAHLDPEILLVDEVLAVGDSAFQNKCIRRIKAIGQGMQTVFFVSHSMAAVRSLCTRAILVDQGVVSCDGPASTVVEEYVKMLATTAGGQIDLSGHPSRGKGCLPLLKAVRFINNEGVTTDSFGCGEPFTVALDFDPARPLEQPHFGIGFDDALGQRIFSVATYLSDTQLPPLRRPATIYCRLPGLNVAPGTYILSLSAGSGHDRLIDALHSAVAIDITATDYFGNGKLPHPSLGQILVRSEWEVDDESTQTAGQANGAHAGAAPHRRP